MKKVLLLVESEEFGHLIRNNLRRDYSVLLCHNTVTATDLMAQKPDALVVQIQLPGTDGMCFLEQLPWRPSVILSLSAEYPPYVAQKLYDLGVGYFIRTPCTLQAVTDRLRDMMREWDYSHEDPQKIAATHLRILGISSKRDGGKQLRIAIPLYAQDTSQKLTGELYPAIARICGSTTTGVEKQIRRTIQDAWRDRCTESWAEYFPRRMRCPSNSVFISTLAEKIWPD